MSIPVSALKDDELLHYAALDPGAAVELARRIADNGIDPSAEREELREDIRELESRIEGSDDELDNLRGDAHNACEWIKRAMDPKERELSTNELLQKALDCLE